jgi:hypothetical protein
MNINTLKGALPIAARLLAEKCGLKVRIGGNRASASPSEIVLPGLPIEVEKARVLGLGFVLHEGAGHIVHTDFESVAAMDLPAFTYRIYNALEDVRIEGLVERRYPGANRIFTAMRETLSNDGQLREMSNSSDLAEALITATMHMLNWRQLKRTFFQGREAIAMQWLTSAFGSSFADTYLTVIDKVQFAQSSADAARIAIEAVSLLQQYAEENRDPEQNSSESEDNGQADASGDSSKADSDSNGEAGSGGDSGNPGDGEQDDESGGDGDAPSDPASADSASAGAGGSGAAAEDDAASTDEGMPSQGPVAAYSDPAEDPSSAQGGAANVGGNGETQPDPASAGADGRGTAARDDATSTDEGEPSQGPAAAESDPGEDPSSAQGGAADAGGNGETQSNGGGKSQGGAGSAVDPSDGSQPDDGSRQEPGPVSGTEDGTGANASADNGQQTQANGSGGSSLDLSQKATSRDVRAALGAGYNPGEDLGEIVQGMLNGMAAESDMLPVLSNAIPFTEEIEDNGEIVQRVKRESIALRRRLTTALEAVTETRSWDAYAGERLSNLGALRLSTGDLNIFERESSRSSIDVAIHILLDRSGSMRQEERMTLAMDTCTALGIALGQIDGVQVATSAFPAGSEECDRDVLVLNRFGESVRKRAGRIAAARADGHNTPLADAMLYGQYSLLSAKATRRILLPITDGMPDSKEGVVDVVGSCQCWGIEVMGVGIGLDISGVIPNSICITEVADLPTRMFELLRKQLVLKKAA